MRAILRKKAISSLVAGTMLLGGVGLAVGGVFPVPLDVMNTSHAGDSPEDHGPPDDVPRGEEGADAEGDEVEAQGGDGPDEEASDTAHRVHAAREAAKALGEGAPPCAVGVYVSSAARGDYDPETDSPPTDFPCENGNSGEGADLDGEGDEDGGPPAHARGKADVDGDGNPGRGGPPDSDG